MATAEFLTFLASKCFPYIIGHCLLHKKGGELEN